jgi:hypothetical protein
VTTLKSLVRDQLAGAPIRSWLTVAQIVDLIPTAKKRDETVARALRKLFAEGEVDRQVVPGTPRFKQWMFTGSSTASPAPSAPTTTLAPQAKGSRKRSKGSAGRQTMSNTFQTAVESVITEFVAAQKAFSAYDVTKELRTATNAGTIAVDKAETGVVHVNGAEVPKIEHEKVKALVHDLFDAGKMPSYDRANNGQFWTYTPSSQTSVADPGNGSGTPAPVNGGNYDGSSTL